MATMSDIKCNRLKISKEVLDMYFKKVPNQGENPAYTHNGFPDTVFMQYQEKGEIFFTLIGAKDYQRIKHNYWSGTNNYVSASIDGKTVYLHRLLCLEVEKGQFVHHKSSRFDNRPGLTEAVSPKEHDQHRTYIGDMIVSVRR